MWGIFVFIQHAVKPRPSGRRGSQRITMMIISEQQINQLITLLRQAMTVFAVSNSAQDFYENCDKLLCDIANQQSQELKQVK